MTLLEIVEAQKALDKRIHEEKGLDPSYTIKNRVVALTVELAEMANEMRFFKYWSNKPPNHERILEEAADCLHFIVSIGNDLGYKPVFKDNVKVNLSRSDLYMGLLRNVAEIEDCVFSYSYMCQYFEELLACYNITKDELFEEYGIKNRINHQRQDQGY